MFPDKIFVPTAPVGWTHKQRGVDDVLRSDDVKRCTSSHVPRLDVLMTSTRRRASRHGTSVGARRATNVGRRMMVSGLVLLLAVSPDRTAGLGSDVSAVGPHTWQTPGCHRIGHTRRISVPNCVEFDITTNACRGYCESWSVLSNGLSPAGLSDGYGTKFSGGFTDNLQPRITSVGQCCNIMDSEDLKVKVMCVDGPQELVFKSAKSCACFHCKKY
ncbi:uncharacterized protein LOC108682862 [Hyalella azteca]|uniref:Uncharacterized protein LOC108682862 n=1 Tax=Hyalella azteca TaxID=294128 RepID=A0A8B7PQ60_HYAAZ|nr:uncharacterized protein LOC108682862 [Hyalella azteca]